MNTATRLLAATIVALLVLGASRPALAQSQDAAAAETAFQLGRKALADKRYGEACDAFRESQRIQSATGTLFNIGLCSMALGRTATAWAAFKAVAADTKPNPERARAAENHVAALAPRLSRIKIEIDGHAAETRFEVDGVVIGALVASAGIPVDPGPRVVRASRPGFEAWQTSVVIREGVPILAISVPPLKQNTVPALATAPRPRPSEPDRLPGWIIGGAGLLTIGAGSVFGALAVNDARDARDCGGGCLRGSDDARRANDAFERGQIRANVANVIVPLGAVVVVIGTYLVLKARPRTAASAQTGVLVW